jgi:hypothetical protein
MDAKSCTRNFQSSFWHIALMDTMSPGQMRWNAELKSERGKAMQITATVDMRNLERRLSVLRTKEIPSAIRNTLNDLAMDCRKMIVAEIPRVFDRPVPIVRSMPRYVKTNNKELQSKLILTGFDRGGNKASASYAFLPHLPGEPDTRRPKGLEPRLRRKGLLGGNEWLMPTPAAPLNAYGNVKPSEVARMIADLGAYQQAARDARNTKLSTLAKRKGGMRYIWIRRKSASQDSGIFRKMGNTIVPMFVVTGEPRYSKRFRFAETVKKYAATKIAYHADRAIAQAIRKRG